MHSPTKTGWQHNALFNPSHVAPFKYLTPGTFLAWSADAQHLAVSQGSPVGVALFHISSKTIKARWSLPEPLKGLASHGHGFIGVTRWVGHAAVKSVTCLRKQLLSFTRLSKTAPSLLEVTVSQFGRVSLCDTAGEQLSLQVCFSEQSPVAVPTAPWPQTLTKEGPSQSLPIHFLSEAAFLHPSCNVQLGHRRMCIWMPQIAYIWEATEDKWRTVLFSSVRSDEKSLIDRLVQARCVCVAFLQDALVALLTDDTLHVLLSDESLEHSKCVETVAI